MRFYRSLGPIAALTFDLDDTLYDNAPVIQQLETNVAAWFDERLRALGLEYQPVQWQRFKRQVLAGDANLANDVTRWRLEQYKWGFSCLGVANGDQLAAEAVDVALYWRSRFSVAEETHQLLSALAQRWPLVAITNGNVDVNTIGLSPYFQAVFRAGPDGPAKPHPQLFHLAQQALNIPAHQILHIGDHGVTDVLGARQFGMQTCWLNRSGRGREVGHHLRILPDFEIDDIHQLHWLL